jgi:4'-phosphopantetheinyl transferase
LKVSQPFTGSGAFPFAGLSDGVVHVWLANVGGLAEREHCFWSVLSRDERERAECFCSSWKRGEFIRTRGALRSLLGKYLSVDPSSIQLDYNVHGKPRLMDPWEAESSIRFNVAHSGEFALFAFVRRRPIGVDIERVRPDFPSDKIAQRFFARTEAAALQSLPGNLRTEAFFAGWTRKEAFIKAKGLGFSLPLNHFAVTLSPMEKPALLYCLDDPQAVQTWTVCDLALCEGYRSALAVEGSPFEVRCWPYA